MIFAQPFFTQMLLPFIFVFVLMFAILQKTKVLGENKSQIDSMISLVVALITIGVSPARNFIVAILPWLAVGVAVILMFLLLYLFSQGNSNSTIPKGVKITLGVLSGLFVLAVLIYYSGVWGYLKKGPIISSETLTTIITIIIVIGVVVWVGMSGKGSSSSENSEK